MARISSPVRLPRPESRQLDQPTFSHKHIDIFKQNSAAGRDLVNRVEMKRSLRRMENCTHFNALAGNRSLPRHVSRGTPKAPNPTLNNVSANVNETCIFIYSDKKSDEKKMKTIVFLGSLFYLVSNSDAKTFKMGTLVPFSGSWRGGPKMASAILIAMDKVNDDPYWLQGHNLSYVMKDSRCEAEASIVSVIDLYTLEDPIVDVYIGPGCSTGCLPGAFIAAHWGIPMISWGCGATDLSDKATYPYFVRTTGTFTGAGDLMRALMERYNWKRLGIMATTDVFFSGTANSAKVKLEEDGKFLVPFFGSFDPGSTDRNKLKSMVISMASKARGRCHNFLSQQDIDRSAKRARSSRILIKTDSVQSSSNYLQKLFTKNLLTTR